MTDLEAAHAFSIDELGFRVIPRGTPMAKPAILQLEEIDWVDERAQTDLAPEQIIAATERRGGRRKRLAAGEHGIEFIVVRACAAQSNFA